MSSRSDGSVALARMSALASPAGSCAALTPCRGAGASATAAALAPTWTVASVVTGRGAEATAAVAAAPLAITTLATVHVTASAADAAKASAPRHGVVVAQDAAGEASVDIRASATLPSLRLDMPYYSFGKMLPRVGKE